MKIREKKTGRIFTQDGDWQTFNRDWNNDGDVYPMTICFFVSQDKKKERYELVPDDIGPYGDFEVCE